MSENFERYRRALAGFDRTIRQVPDDPWEAPSPCTEWRAIDVAGHVIGVQQMITRGLTTGSLLGEGRPTPREVAGDDPVGRWAEAVAALEEAAAVEGALDRVVQTPFGEMSVDAFVGILLLDAITHTWDLARAAGLDDRLDPELVHIAFERVRPLDQAIRRGGFFGPRREPPPGADEQTELMAFLGREV